MMIPRRLKTCKGCEKPSYLFSRGLCQRCWALNKEHQPKEKVPHKGLNKPKKANEPTNDKFEDKKVMNAFFESQIERIPRCCENCDEPFGFIPNWKIKWRMAHILPKKDGTFESVKTNPDNLMFLCDECHGNWDNKNQAYRRSTKVYTIAMERVEKFYHLLTDHEQVLLTKYL